MRKIKNVLLRFLTWMEQNIVIDSLRQGLVYAIPFLLIGSMGLVITSFPNMAYHQFIVEFANGLIYSIGLWLNKAMLGNLALILIVTISYSFSKRIDMRNKFIYPISSLCIYLIFTMGNDGTISATVFETTWLFTAILVTIMSCLVLNKSFKICKKLANKNYKEGTDLNFQGIMNSIVPIVLTSSFFIVLKLIILKIFGTVNIQNLGSDMFFFVFEKIGNNFIGILLFVILLHMLWFFGLHGDNALINVSMNLFEGGMATNIALDLLGKAPTEIYTKTFLDTFVLCGGTGATLCLLLAMFVESRKNKKAANSEILKVSVIPAIFNINDLVILGIPIVFNPILLVPFIVVPVVLLVTSTLAMKIGLVPIPVHSVMWTTPIFINGIVSTDSIRGGILQLVNLVIGTAIYLPFVKYSAEHRKNILKDNIKKLRDIVIAGEETGKTVNLLDGSIREKETAKMLISDLRYAIEEEKIDLYYQPQVYSDGTILGAEALLRWNHTAVSYIYPPLVIELSKEGNMVDELGMYIIERVCSDIEKIALTYKEKLKISVNISPVQLEHDKFCEKVIELINKYDFGNVKLYFEVTEQIALASTDIIKERIDRIREVGIEFIMDDFGMGHSSMIYLQDNEFASVKLDGSLVQHMLDNKKSYNIIGGIQQLAENLGCSVIAEYVETKEQQESLESLGCHIYQGYLFSKAIELDEFKGFIEKHNKE